MSRNKVDVLSAGWAKTLGYAHSQPIHSTVFSYDDDAKTFLEYELGGSAANELMREQIPIWYWVTRYCVPLKQEEFFVSVSPQGRLIKFNRTVPNDFEMHSLSAPDAKRTAREFVEAIAKVSLANYKLVENGPVQQVKRVDYIFTWEDQSAEYHDARKRIEVELSGDQVTGFNYFLHIPEKWTRSYSKLRSFNSALAAGAGLFYVAIWSGAFFVFLWALSAGVVRWKFAAITGVSFGVLSAAETLNSLPMALYEYKTSSPFSAFQIETGMSVLSAFCEKFFLMFVLVAAAEAVYRMLKPHDISLPNTFTRQGLRSKKTFYSILIGFALFGLHLGWVAVYYLGGRHFGFWTPLEVDNAEALSSYAPFLSAMDVGWWAGLSEELMYRVLALAAVQKLTRRFWIANLAQALLWGFAHSDYPQEPPYARGLELTAVGIVYGYILRRYGLLTCFFSHNLLDTYLSVVPLLSSSLKTLQLSALLALSPFAGLFGLSAFQVKKYGFVAAEEESTLLNEYKEPLAATTELSLPTVLSKGYLYKPLTVRMRTLLVAVIVLGLSIVMFVNIPLLGGQTKVKIGREQAVQIAELMMKQNGLDPHGFSVATQMYPSISSDQFQYIYEKEGLAKADQLSMLPERPLCWLVRFFRPLVEEEFQFVIAQDGTPQSINVIEPESAPGEPVSLETARERAEKFLLNSHPEVVFFTFLDSQEVKRDARTDRTFRFTVPKYKVGDAKYVVSVDSIGGRVSGYETYWMLPQSWTFERSITTLRQQIATCVLYVFLVICTIAILWWSGGVVRSKAINWRPAMLLGLAVSVLALASTLNQLPLFFSSYKTDTPVASFVMANVAGDAIVLITNFAFGSVFAAFGLASMRLLLPDTTLGAIVKSSLAPKTAEENSAHRNLWIDGVLVGYAAALADLACRTVSGLVSSRCSPEHMTAPLESVSHLLNQLEPSAAVLVDSCISGYFFVFGAAIAAGICAKYLYRFRSYLLFSVALSLVFVATQKYWQDAVVTFVGLIISAVFSWLFVTRLARENLLAYFFAGTASTMIISLRVLWKYAPDLSLQDCLGLILFLLAPLFYSLLRMAGERPGNTTTPNGSAAGSVSLEADETQQ